MKGQPKKSVVVLGVSALARETGVAKSTISERMRRGQTADEIRAYAAMRDGRSPKRASTRGAVSPRTHESSTTNAEYEIVLRGRAKLEAIDDAKLRRAQALAERSELDNMLRRGELVPVSYIRTWGSRFLTDARDTLMTGPSELQDMLAAEGDPLKVSEILRGWLERTMTKLHQLDRLWGTD